MQVMENDETLPNIPHLTSSTGAITPGSNRPPNENTMLTEVPQPALPADKQYHVMFSFQSEDRVWVRRMLETLEAPPYNLKCCIADRDFHPGREVMQNIEVSMQESLNIVLVMSPEHLESHYCDFETNLAIELHHEKKGRVIPVLRRGEFVPGSLRFINYIDARDGVNECEVIGKLAAAITKDTDKKSMSRSYNLMDPQYKNGEEVSLSSSRRPVFALGLTTISDMTTCHLQACHKLGIKYVMHEVEPLLWTASLQWAFSGCAVLAVIVFFWRLHAQKKRTSFSGLISQHTYKRKLLFAIGDNKKNAVIRFIRYDVLNCQEYIRENLVSVGDLGQTTGVEEMTRMILEAGIAKYMKVVIDSHPIAPTTRHHVRRDLVCLCQYVEMEQIHLEVQRKNAGQSPDSQSEIVQLI